jgi:putative addiction module killer protein
VIEIEECVTADGRSPFADWLDGLDAVTAARLVAVLHRIEAGNFGDVAPVRAGVSERRIDFGPGYRIYFGSIGQPRSIRSIVLLCGGTKGEQRRDIPKARQRWKDYRKRKRY